MDTIDGAVPIRDFLGACKFQVGDVVRFQWQTTGQYVRWAVTERHIVEDFSGIRWRPYYTVISQGAGGLPEVRVGVVESDLAFHDDKKGDR